MLVIDQGPDTYIVAEHSAFELRATNRLGIVFYGRAKNDTNPKSISLLSFDKELWCCRTASESRVCGDCKVKTSRPLAIKPGSLFGIQKPEVGWVGELDSAC